MVNKLLLEAGKKFAAENAEQKKQRDAEMATRAITSKFPRLTYLKNDEPLFFSFLHETVYDFPVHDIWTGSSMEYHLCDKTYQAADPSFADSCEKCEELNDYGNKRRPKQLAFAIIYAHSYEGKTGKTKKGKEFTFNTTVILPINPGKGGSNLAELAILQGRGSLVPGKRVFQIKKTGEGKDTIYHPPIPCHPDDLGDEFNPNSDEFKAALAKYAAMSDEEVIQGLLINLKNVKYDLFGIDEPVADVVESENETITKPAGRKAKDGLN